MVARRTRRSRFPGLLSGLLILALLCSPLVLAYFVIEDTRLVEDAKSLNPEDAERAKRLLKATWEGLVDIRDDNVVTASEADLNSLFALVTRGLPGAVGHANITSQGLEGAISAQLPPNPVGSYINLRIGMAPSSSGLEFTHATLGGLRLPGWMATAAIRGMLDFSRGEHQGTRILGSIQSVAMHSDRITVTIRPIPELKRVLENFAVRANLGLVSDPAVVRIYYGELMKTAQAVRGRGKVSIGHFIQPVFRLASKRSLASDAVDENRAAILALVVYLGDSRFEKFIGPVRTGNMGARYRVSGSVVLAGRRDLRLHFIISAGLELLSDRGITNAIGEFKELLDTRSRGSGFSFADLAADRAGVVFAETATRDKNSAVRLQRQLRNSVDEGLFFPSVADLQEGISRTEFAQQYNNTDSEAYRGTVAEIDERLRKLPAYR